MSSSAAQTYARVAFTTASPRENEAKALLMAANKLQVVLNDSEATHKQVSDALIFNRKLWTIFLSEAQREENPQPLDVRQNIANLGLFVLSHTAALEVSRQRAPIKALIDINRNIAAGLAGRASE
ncbi:MAG TPA: flagellar biosynthesis regulator FlaF [Bradyrhizobium sp.]|nr:flagellar biosynthesis regulator FlaF [Bradyrhizobium sp.]